jgi:hypothetical protein
VPHVPAAILCFGFHGTCPAAGGSIKALPPARKAHEYSKQEAPASPVGRNLNLCSGVHRILALPALSHDGEKLFSGFRGSEFSPHLFPLVACVIQRTNSSEREQQDRCCTG